MFPYRNRCTNRRTTMLNNQRKTFIPFSSYWWQFFWFRLISWRFMNTFHRTTQPKRSNKCIRPSKSSLNNFSLSFINSVYIHAIWRYPFDWRTPNGYVLCMFIQSVEASVIVLCIAATLPLIVGVCMFAGDFVLDIEHNLHELNEQFVGAKGRPMSFQEIVRTKEKLIDNIQFHSDARE